MTAPPGLPAASPAELGRGALPAALPDGGVWLADGSSESWRAPMGVGQAATRRAARVGHLSRSPPRRCCCSTHSGSPRGRQSPPTHLAAPHEPATADHHGWPRRAGMVPLGTAQLRRYLVLAWRLLALHALESPTLPPCAQSTPQAAHLGRYTAVALGAVSASSSRQHVRRVVCAWLEPTCV